MTSPILARRPEGRNHNFNILRGWSGEGSESRRRAAGVPSPHPPAHCAPSTQLDDRWLEADDAPLVLPLQQYCRVLGDDEGSDENKGDRDVLEDSDSDEGDAPHVAGTGEEGVTRRKKHVTPAEMLEEREDQSLSEKPLLFIQFPQDLPTGTAFPHASSSLPKEAKDNPAFPREFQNRLRDLGSGTIGSLRIHKSGRVTMAMGKLTFEVTPSAECQSRQQLAVLDDDEGRHYDLGDIEGGRLAIVPHVDVATGEGTTVKMESLY